MEKKATACRKYSQRFSKVLEVKVVKVPNKSLNYLYSLHKPSRNH